MNGAGEFAVAAARLAGQAGLLFGWRPDEFWAATPAELGVIVAALAGDAGASALDADAFEMLRGRFPDER